MLRSRLSLQLNSAITYKLTTDNTCTFQCAQIIKESLDKNYGGAGYWNVVVGESFDVKLLYPMNQISSDYLFQVNCCYDEGSKMLVYFGGTMGAFIWKCSM